MISSPTMLPPKLDSPEALEVHLAALLARDPRLVPVAATAGPFELRTTSPGFAGLGRVICGQQLSVASARAIWARFEALPGALVPETYLELSEETVRGIGFSLSKYKTMRALAEAIIGGLDLAHIETLPAEDAVAALSAVRGIGPWTAEIYLMFCAGHPDIFPAGDLALQKGVAHALDLPGRPAAKDLVELAKAWTPHRATAALLFWRYYAATRGKDGGIAL